MKNARRKAWWWWRALLGALAALLPLACSSQPRHAETAPVAATEDEVVVLVPGITGVQLREKDTGLLLWGNGRRLLSPRDGGAALLNPLGEPGRDVEAFAPIREIRLFGLRKPIYGPVLDLLGRGRRLGDLESPRPGDGVFAFSYDWRQSNVTSAQRLARLLAGVRDVQPKGRVAVALVCQSNGAHVCRYLAKYGGASLDDAEAGRGGIPPGVEIRKVILVGTANGGSLRILREMNRGRRYLAPFGRRLRPEALFTFASLYQELPGYRRDLFVGPDGQGIEADLFDAATWERYQWSIYGPEAARRLEQLPEELYGTPEERRAFLEQQLAEAQRVQALLRQDSPAFGRPSYYLIQNAYRETPGRALLVKEGGQWETYFTGDRRLKKREHLRALTSAPGDGHATVQSQEWLSPQELSALASEPFYVRDAHFELILHPAAQTRLRQILREGLSKP